MEHGTFFTEIDVRSAAKVAVLGSLVRDNLFGEGADPVGERIRIRNQSFQVIGVLEPKGSGQFGQDQDDTILAPYTTVQKKLLGRDGTNISGLTISAASPDQMDQTIEEISAVLRTQHRLSRGEEDDFMIRTQEDLVNMRVSVTELTREIGLRMSVGAKGRDILYQFLTEAVVLSLVGGLVGVGLGFGLSEGVTRVLQWPTSVPADAVALAVGVAAVTGIFFGYYPARQAARRQPIESLRFE